MFSIASVVVLQALSGSLYCGPPFANSTANVKKYPGFQIRAATYTLNRDYYCTPEFASNLSLTISVNGTTNRSVSTWINGTFTDQWQTVENTWSLSNRPFCYPMVNLNISYSILNLKSDAISNDDIEQQSPEEELFYSCSGFLNKWNSKWNLQQSTETPYSDHDGYIWFSGTQAECESTVSTNIPSASKNDCLNITTNVYDAPCFACVSSNDTYTNFLQVKGDYAPRVVTRYRNETRSGHKLDAGDDAGITIGVLGAIAIFTVIGLYIVQYRKQQQKQEAMESYWPDVGEVIHGDNVRVRSHSFS
eukprot:m.216072 g.216072  ORF g.216072 m.216072 type:complete len:305 (-) comp33202_c5_seq9:2931-3845(-)